MKSKYLVLSLLTLFLIAFAIVFLSRTNQFFGPLEHLSFNQPSRTIGYRILSTEDFDKDKCISYGRHGPDFPGAFSVGFDLVAVDKDTKDRLQHASMYSGQDSGGSVNGEYTCEGNLNSSEFSFFVNSLGYAPAVFSLDLPKDKLTKLEVSMVRSCSGGPSFFDNLETIAAQYDNRTYAEEYKNESTDEFYHRISSKFGLDKGNYSLECAEADISRGGYVKAKGFLKDGSRFELFYWKGLCSSGGSNCGWGVCFKTDSDDTYQAVKENICKSLSSGRAYDKYICTGGEPFDDTDKEIQKCLEGGYEQVNGAEKTLALIQDSGRCRSSVEQNSFECINN